MDYNLPSAIILSQLDLTKIISEKYMPASSDTLKAMIDKENNFIYFSSSGKW